MTGTTSRFDPMKHLDSDEDHIDLLNDALATRDTRVIVNVIREIVLARKIGRLAKDGGVDKSSLYEALGDDIDPTIGVIMTVLADLHIELQVKPAAVHVGA